MNEKNNVTFEEKYSVVYEHYNEAKSFYDEGKIKYTLSASRNTLESIVNIICEKCGIDTDIELFEKIELLKDNKFLDNKEANLLHKIRKLGNKGAHSGKGNEEEPTIEEAEEAVEALEKIMEMFRCKEDPEYFEAMKDKNNIPMTPSDYYNARKRKYFGLWSNCYSREELESQSEYFALKKQADNGDISAMLDIASGFLPKREGILWTKENLICMPKYHFKGQDYYNENGAFDSRYYYWVLKACQTACNKKENGETYPKKYIANALLDAIKFEVYTSHSYELYVSSVDSQFNRNTGKYDTDKIHTNQYELITDIYCENIFTIGNIYDFTVMLLELIDEYGTDIISIHRENDAKRIKYLTYCFACINSEKFPNLDYTPDYIIDESDNQDKINLEILEKYIDDEVCKSHYQFTKIQIDVIRKAQQPFENKTQPQYQPPQQPINEPVHNSVKLPVSKKTLIIAIVVLGLIIVPLFRSFFFSLINIPKSNAKVPHSVTEITENPFNFEFKKQAEKKAYSFTTEREGIYRFDFGTDDVECTYLVKLYDSENIEIFDEKCNEYERGTACTLKANEKYTIVAEQNEGYPNAKITIGMPQETKIVENNEINDSFEYTDQENTYIFHTKLEGVYYFQFTSDNVENNYNVKIKNDINEEIFDSFFGTGESVRLNADTDYKIIVTQHSGFPNYKIIINEPLPAKTVTGSFSGELTFQDQENIYYFTPEESGVYNITLDFENANCNITLKDDVNNQLFRENYSYTYQENLEKGKTYTFIAEYWLNTSKYNIVIEKQ